MDTTLVINPGSSSKKYALYRQGSEVMNVLFEHTKEGYGQCVEINGKRQKCEVVLADVYETALQETLKLAKQEGAIQSVQEIRRVGIRVVAPGTYFQKHRVVHDDYISYLKAMEGVAPLHIPGMLRELEALFSVLDGVTVIGVSDSAFHSTMPKYVRTYSLPRKDSESHDIYKFGYHGISVSSVLYQAHEMLGVLPSRTIVCHVGSGVSVTAVCDGQSVDTSMGFAPGDGLMMGSRAGDTDLGALLYLMKVKNFRAEEAEAYINEQGGFRGLINQNDLRIVLDRMARGDVEAKDAILTFTYNIKKKIGAFAAALGGVDLIILTATAAERNPTVRALVCDGLEYLGIDIDVLANENLGTRPGTISDPKSGVKVLVLHTNEMFEIARITESVHP
jgi:acetate kinase